LEEVDLEVILLDIQKEPVEVELVDLDQRLPKH
jgi:hypothetical protein